MSYSVEPTKALVLRTYPLGEASQGLLLFTRSHGLLRAKAQSGRAVHSKMQPYFNIFTLADFALIDGKTGWLVTGVQNSQFSFGETFKHRIFLDRLIALLQLLPEEQVQVEVFEDVVKVYEVLARPGFDYKKVEIHTVSRFLRHLGYWPDNVAVDFINMSPGDVAGFSAKDIRQLMSELVPQINVGLAALTS